MGNRPKTKARSCNLEDLELFLGVYNLVNPNLYGYDICITAPSGLDTDRATNFAKPLIGTQNAISIMPIGAMQPTPNIGHATVLIGIKTDSNVKILHFDSLDGNNRLQILQNAGFFNKLTNVTFEEYPGFVQSDSETCILHSIAHTKLFLEKFLPNNVYLQPVGLVAYQNDFENYLDDLHTKLCVSPPDMMQSLLNYFEILGSEPSVCIYSVCEIMVEKEAFLDPFINFAKSKGVSEITTAAFAKTMNQHSLNVEDKKDLIIEKYKKVTELVGRLTSDDVEEVVDCIMYGKCN